MRRGSIVGPVILIVIGAVFLLNNIRPDLSILEMLASYWPFLLIVWGALRLVEILIVRDRGTGLAPERGISGGEWLLIVFLCLLGSGAFFFKRNIGHWPPNSIRAKIIGDFGEAYDYPIDEKKVATGKAPRVLIENLRGNTRVTGTDALEVKVTGRKTVRALQQSAADEANRQSPVELTNQGDLIVVRTNQESASGDRRLSADLEITVPKGATIEGHGRYGDFEMNDIGGNVEVTSDNAGVRLQNVGGGVRLDLRRSDIVRAINVKGPVELKGRGQNVELENIEGQVTISGSHGGDLQFRNLAKQLRFDEDRTNVQVERCPGQIRMARGYIRATNLVGPVHMTSQSKDVEITDFTQSLELSIDRGDVDLRPVRIPLSKMDVRTSKGEISLAIPNGARFEMRGDVQKGEVENEFGDPIRTESAGRGGSLRGGMPDGPVIVLNADRGSVIVRKAGAPVAVPAPVAPPAPVPPMPGKNSKLIFERN